MRRLLAISILFIAGAIPFLLAPKAYASFCFIPNGCTGTSTVPAYGQILVGGKNGEYEYVASSTFGSGASSGFSTTSTDYWLTTKSTTNLSEGSNLYWTQIRFDTALTATTSLPKITTLSSLSLPYSQLTGTPDLTQYLKLSDWYATTTDQLKEGTTNLYFTNARARAALSSTYPIQFAGGIFSPAFGTTTSNLWGGTQTFTNNPILGALTGLVYGNSGTLNQIATSSLTISSPLTTSGTPGALVGGTALTVGCQTASGSQAGCLSSTDWPTFNGKQGSLGSGTAGQILAWLNGAPAWTATTTFSAPLSYLNGAVTCPTCNTSSASVTSVAFATPNSTLSLGGTNPVTTSGTINADLNLAHSNWWLALQNFTDASTSQFTATSTVWFTSLGTPSGTFLAVDPNGKVIATSTPAVGGSGTVTSVATNNGITGGTITTTGTLSLDQTFGAVWTPASTTYTQHLAINTASTTQLTAPLLWTGLTTYNLLATDANGKMVATSSIGNSLLTNSSLTVTATSPLTGGGSVSLGGSTSLGIQAASASQNGYLAQADYSLLHAATTTFSSPLLYTLGTNAVTCPTCQTSASAWPWTSATNFGTTTNSTTTPLWEKTGLFASSTSQFDNASTTQLTTGTFWDTNVTSALASFDANHKESSYGGNSCGANTFASSINGAGVLSCTSVPNAALANSTIGATSPNSTLSFGSAAALGSTFTGDLNLGHSNWWTALQNLSNASTSQFTATSSVWFTGIPAQRPLYVDANGLLGSAGTGTNGNCVKWGANNTLADQGAACGSGGGTGVDLFTHPGVGQSATTSTMLFYGNASTTMFTATSSVWITSVTAAIRSNDANGKVGAYGGATCTNQFVRSLNGAGAATCATVANTDLSNSSLTVTAGTGLNGGGSISLGGSGTLSLTVPVVIANGGTATTTGGNVKGVFFWDGVTYTNSPNFIFSTSSPANLLTVTNASTTNLSAATSFYAPFASAVMVTDANKLAGAATTQTCTNQFVRAMSAAYVATCASVGSADLAAGVFANPTGTIGLAAVNGSAGTAMRSDGAPALSQAIAPTWTARHIFSSDVLMGTSTSLLGETIIGTSTVPQLMFSDNLGSNMWSFRNAGGTLFIATSTASATSTTATLILKAAGSTNSTAGGLLVGGTTTNIATSNVATFTRGGTGTTTITIGEVGGTGKGCINIQNSAGAAVSLYVVGTTLTVTSGGCTP